MERWRNLAVGTDWQIRAHGKGWEHPRRLLVVATVIMAVRSGWGEPSRRKDGGKHKQWAEQRREAVERREKQGPKNSAPLRVKMRLTRTIEVINTSNTRCVQDCSNREQAVERQELTVNPRNRVVAIRRAISEPRTPACAERLA
eukprot:183292-Pleurochrysis_carterae.AAC.4